jgi:hypothetical protein
VKYKVAPQGYEAARGVLLVQRRVLTLPPAKSHHKIVDPNDLPAPEWRNWQTRQLEGLVRIYAGAGSSPVSGNFSSNSSHVMLIRCRFVSLRLTGGVSADILLHVSCDKRPTSLVNCFHPND